jgi:general nucleoside transport system permease protein
MLNQIMQVIISTNFLEASLRIATPLILACMGGILAERSGVLNLGIDGMMLMGAFAGFAGTYFSGSPWIGLLCAIISAMFFGLIHSFSCVSLGLNQIVIAVAINILALGLTSSLLRTLFGSTTNQLKSAGFAPIEIPFLSSIPVIGTIFFKQTILVYIGLILIPLTWWYLYKTTWGLKVRAVGENPRAAQTMGVNVTKVRYFCILYASALAGVGGASLSIAGLNTFIDNITAGRGFIAFAAIVFGKFNPLGAAAGAAVFGIADCLQLNIQALGINIPYQIPLMFPYILTLIALFIVGTGISPKSWGAPYYPEGE